MPTLTLTTRNPAELAVDTLVVGVAQGSEGAALLAGHGLPTPAVAHLEAVLSDLDATGKADEVHRVVSVPGVRATSVVVTGVGPAADPSALRSAAGAALRSVRTKASVALALPTPDLADLAAVAEGAYAGCYAYAKPVGATAAGRRRPAKKAASIDGPWRVSYSSGRLTSGQSPPDSPLKPGGGGSVSVVPHAAM